jgi:hypothetical protein
MRILAERDAASPSASASTNGGVTLLSANVEVRPGRGAA